ncbi:MAG TPA: hypothetical protein PLZ48_00865 [Candidatus Cloacimonas sp.]|jgi:hypothetical protein|nr:hypothetical protein [Candidatus Cloacimonas sp.]HNQ39267.1 hypothetical protein [Candidatus Cloacimonas sp.]HNS84622.1 hypothetical protein [Candidatus Cloacimonas sp.]HPA24055.1 hypothetical protein [Candidatus Cloacimonas sp.]HPX09756.1 hypothetical protein [Candidatus Cloacimonas sp.]
MIGYKELIQKLKKIKEMGWIKTHRAGTTGIGKSTVIIFLKWITVIHYQNFILIGVICAICDSFYHSRDKSYKLKEIEESAKIKKRLLLLT